MDDDDSNNPNDAVGPGNLQRRSSSGAMAFLSTVKAAQKIKRREMLKKTRSNRTVQSTESAAALSPGQIGVVGEDTPLMTTDRLSIDLDQINEGSGGEGGGGPPVDEIEFDITTKEALCQIYFGKGPISLLLGVAPFAILSVLQGWNSIWVFTLNFLVMIPLASILGDFTEEAALHTNETIGGA